MPTLIVLGFAGLLAQLVDGSLGMGYGVTSTTILVAAGIAPAAASAAVHFAQIGTTLASGISHHKFGNVDWRIVAILAGPGAVGAFIGATALTRLSSAAAKPIVASLLLALGFYVLYRFLRLGGTRPQFSGKVSARFLVPLGFAGGTLDAFGGGGWGPVGTTTLLSSGRVEPRKVVGSVSASEFVVSVSASIGFLFGLGAAGINWAFAAALLIGGVIAAPFAAWMVRHLSPRILGTAAGGLIIITNTFTLLNSTGASTLVIAPVLGTLFLVLIVLVVHAVRAVRRDRTPDPVLVPAS
ncbi:sulfite exporter TauE/SafE family protein [Dietzia psychralcaliphila]|uniref:sulfite exporter TauE/SafE family protein n=1 Tax=Dietzia psychralcaliphila TaxID=139021 RepID=UPI001C1E41EB|nr:sulfite exporter TauE/SafE family protein [Dietzia psychralcaliphila]